MEESRISNRSGKYASIDNIISLDNNHRDVGKLKDNSKRQIEGWLSGTSFIIKLKLICYLIVKVEITKNRRDLKKFKNSFKEIEQKNRKRSNKK